MHKNDIEKCYREATLALFSSLSFESAITSLYEVLKSYIPLDSLIVHLLDLEKMQIKIIADATKEFHESYKNTEITEQYRDGVWLDELKEGTARVIKGDLSNTLSEVLLKKYGYSSTSVYWCPLIIDNQHFGEFSALISPGYNINEYDEELLKLLQKPLAAYLVNSSRYEEISTFQKHLTTDIRHLKKELNELKGVDVIDKTPGLKSVAYQLHRVAHLDTPVLILGETGVGKEVIANSLHDLSSRHQRPLVVVNCGTLPPNLTDSYLFGHEKGAFTGADQLRKGYFERAHGGTLFLDEIGELPLEVQVKLLRVLEEKVVERVGGSSKVPTDVRLIAATHRNLQSMVDKGEFREDLWYRLNVFPIVIPPLRQRPEDIPALVAYFIALKSKELRLNYIPEADPDELVSLQSYSFPGNVRELQNLVERALIYYDDSTHEKLTGISEKLSEHVKEGIRRPKKIVTLDEAIHDHIRSALIACDGKVQGSNGAAVLLGLPPSTLRAKIKKLRIKL